MNHPFFFKLYRYTYNNSFKNTNIFQFLFRAKDEHKTNTNNNSRSGCSSFSTNAHIFVFCKSFCFIYILLDVPNKRISYCYSKVILILLSSLFGIIHGVCFSLESNLFWIFFVSFFIHRLLSKQMVI